MDGQVRFARGDSTREFDLTQLRLADRAWKRGGLVYVLALIAAIGAEVGSFAWSQREVLTGAGLASPTGRTDIVLIVLMGALLGGALKGVSRLLPGAMGLTMDSEGLHLLYPAGLREDIPWRDPAGFTLRDYSAFPEMVSANRAFIFSGPQYWRRRTLITEEAMHAILEEAGARDIRVSTRNRRVNSARPAPKIYQVRAGW